MMQELGVHVEKTKHMCMFKNPPTIISKTKINFKKKLVHFKIDFEKKKSTKHARRVCRKEKTL